MESVIIGREREKRGKEQQKPLREQPVVSGNWWR
jgi:hypothetical protein